MTKGGHHRYPGAVPFGESPSDELTFNGRDDDVRALYHAVRANPLTLLFSKSGRGKTSLLRAGVFPLLRQSGYAPALLRLTGLDTDPVASVRDQFTAKLETHYDVDSPDPDGEGSESGLVGFFSRIEVWYQNRLLTPVLVFDQFEELFTVERTAESQAELETHFADLARLAIAGRSPVDARDVPLRIVVAIREDFLGSLERLAVAVPQIFQKRMRLAALTRSQALDAIVKPAAIQDPGFLTEPFSYTDECLEQMLAFLGSATGEVEPTQLQIVCEYAEEVIESRQEAGDSNRVITPEDFRGGLEGVLEQFYNRQLRRLPNDEREKVRRLCEIGLISESQRRLFRAEEELVADFGVDTTTLRRLVELRLLRREDRRNLPYYELAHDSLVAPILAYREAQLKEVTTPLTEPAKQWKSLNEDNGSLLRGKALEAAEEWASQHSDQLEARELERTFLEASGEGRDEYNQRRAALARRYRRLTYGLAIAAALAVVFLVGALVQREIAEAEAENAAAAVEVARQEEQAALEFAALADEEAARAEAEAARAAEEAARAEAEAARAQESLSALQSANAALDEAEVDVEPGTIDGVVVDKSGEPIEGAVVDLSVVDDTAADSSRQEITGSDGQFEFVEVTSLQEFVVAATADGHCAQDTTVVPDTGVTTQIAPIELTNSLDNGGCFWLSQGERDDGEPFCRDAGCWWYEVSLTGFAPGTSVTVSCHSTSSGRFNNARLVVGDDGKAFDPRPCLSRGGQEHWVTIDGVSSNIVSW